MWLVKLDSLYSLFIYFHRLACVYSISLNIFYVQYIFIITSGEDLCLFTNTYIFNQIKSNLFIWFYYTKFVCVSQTYVLILDYIQWQRKFQKTETQVSIMEGFIIVTAQLPASKTLFRNWDLVERVNIRN